MSWAILELVQAIPGLISVMVAHYRRVTRLVVHVLTNECSLQYLAPIQCILSERLVVELWLFSANSRWLRLSGW